MNWKSLGLFSILGGAGTLIYGCLVESKKVQVDRYSLPLKNWPESLDGFRIAHISDLHITDIWSVEIVHKAAMLCVEEKPDVVVITGDFVAYWRDESYDLLMAALEPLKGMANRIIAIPGNHDYLLPQKSVLDKVCQELGISLLKNQAQEMLGIHWVGIDTQNERKAKPLEAFGELNRLKELSDCPTIVLWHEPDMVLQLPQKAHLMLSGHSHGGQYLFPFGLTPKKTRNAKNYFRGFYPNAPTPIFVTRGVGTTGPPTRFLCPPEVAILTLRSSSEK